MERKTRLSLFVLMILLLFAATSCHDEQLVTSPPQISEITVFESKLPVISPKEWETWYMQNTYVIKWKPTEEVKYVKIELVRKFKPKYTIVTETENTGYWEWEVPGYLNPSLHYRIKISDLENPKIVNYSKEFAIKSNKNYSGRVF